MTPVPRRGIDQSVRPLRVFGFEVAGTCALLLRAKKLSLITDGSTVFVPVPLGCVSCFRSKWAAFVGLGMR